MKNLNTYQKTALALAGAIILLIQLIKFSDEGIEGASWILSFAISALLFIPILSDADSILNSIKSSFVRADDVAAITNNAISNETGELFKVLGARAEKLHKFIAEKGTVDTVPFFNVITDRWYPSIVAIVVLTYGVARKFDNTNYYESEEFKKLNGMLFNLIMSISKHQDKLVGGNQTEDALMRQSMESISGAKKAVDMMFSNIVNKHPYADLPVHKYIQSACGFTDEHYEKLVGSVTRHLNSLFIEFSHSTRLI